MIGYPVVGVVSEVEMKKLLVGAVLVVWTSGCACFGEPPEKALLLEIRKDMVESVRPALVDALDNAKGPDGQPLYIDAYRTEKVNLVDRVIQSVDRVYPPEQPYTPEPLPWAKPTDGGQ